MTKEEKNSSVFGKSEEACAGLFIEIGGTFISDQPVEWEIVKRNLGGSKNYRAVLQCISPESKHHLRLSGLKAQFSLNTMSNLHACIKGLTDVYKKYQTNPSNNSDDYVLTKTSASRSPEDKQIEGYFYIIELGKNFFKLGYTTNQQRLFNYITEESLEKRKTEFPEIEFHAIPSCKYMPIQKMKKIKLLEEKIKSLINDSILCQTYECEKGSDIREYFYCQDFDKLLPLIEYEINHD
jgi:hypothetical protein